MSINLYGNIGKFNYKFSDIDLFELAKTQDNKHVKFRDTEAGKYMPEIKVNISPEGLKALHGTKLNGSYDIKAEEEKLKFYSEHQPIEPFRNTFSRIINEGVEKLRTDDPGRVIGISEKENILISGFKNIVNEISAGHDAGTRLRFIHDDRSEDGYRKLTKQEELSILQEEFDSFVSDRFGNNHLKNSEEAIKALNDFQKFKQNLGISSNKPYVQEKISNDFVNRLMKLSREYIEKESAI